MNKVYYAAAHRKVDPKATGARPGHRILTTELEAEGKGSEWDLIARWNTGNGGEGKVTLSDVYDGGNVCEVGHSLWCS